MDGSVVEGISTSLQTCPPDTQAFMALGDLPNSPSISHLHVNDLGLTPPPGSPLQQPTDVLRNFPQGEKHESSDGTPMRTTDGLAMQDGLDPSTGIGHDGLGQKQGHTLSSWGTEGSGHANQHVEKQSTASDMPMSTADESTTSKQEILPETDHNAIDANKAFFFDQVFDSEAVFRELDAVFASRKRSGEDAFPGEFDFWTQPVKKRSVDPTTNELCTTPDETPSLSSADSIARLEQGDSFPHTPAGTDPAKSPDQLFNSLDTLFEDPDFDMPLETPDSFPFDMEPTSFFDQPPDQEQLAPNPVSCPNTGEQVPEPAENMDVAPGPGPAQPCLSDITKERFSLDSQDVIASTSREALQRIYQEPEYTSPYPAYGGPLGYFPSAPSVHVRCIEVGDDRTNYRVSCLKHKVQHLTCERNKYRNAWHEWSTLDQKTGKTKEQMLREENATLKRVSSQHQNRAEQYKKEIIEWKNKMRELGMTYNNLLYEIHVQRQMPAVTPIPAGYKPPTARGPPPAAVTPSASGPRLVPHGAPAPDASAARGHQQQPQQPCATATLASRPANRESRPQPVTIDLTEDTTEQSPAPAPEPSPEEKRQRIEMLQSLRNKKYGWLNETESTGYSGARRPDGVAPVSISHRDQPNGEAAGQGNSGDTDDELARAMEEELAQA
ncbi:hypothetical protein P170DRAFT_67067 [Aspergillus steynii IBT 23096]|uniref:Uncharacterized protein n=1 Tax=Aspergillus steynii IBT 23096 TaxID=1392250 RepID=A0A2I2FTM6_9EURO|nr:uncharacterized protein P170DRAFT_67067 [Aspergillus steynii IBT 23096]PLB43993.1 hypothetical protein P170DRAFT_67067 [Aspergillus steynii IBT 23096]